MLQQAVRQRGHPFYITHIRSHTTLPGPMSASNHEVDCLVSFATQEAQEFHNLTHVNAAGLKVSSHTDLPATQNYSYWAYVPFPPLIQPLTWMDAPVEIYTNDSVWMPGAADDRCPAQPGEEGTALNVTMGYKYPSLCLGRAPGCIHLQTQVWTAYLPERSTTEELGHLVSAGLSLFPLNQMKGGVMGIIENTPYFQYNPAGKPCPKNFEDPSKTLIWEDCVNSHVVILKNVSYVLVIDWAPKGYLKNNCSSGRWECLRLLILFLIGRMRIIILLCIGGSARSFP
nr:putative endogenous retrovirus group K member 11-1 Env polyprotein [Macaca nemestrina]